jgi:hypothetical protein
MLFQLSACSSSSSLQSNRLDTAEEHILEAEQALANSAGSAGIKIADDNLGTANAYLATLNDHKKYLTENELKRYQALKQRSDGLLKRIK